MIEAADKWLEKYKQAWEERDPVAAGSLFTPDALYQEVPFDPPLPGAQGVQDYWARVTATQDDVTFRYGDILVAGDRIIVEWWTTLNDQGKGATFAGIFLLRLEASGLCSELIEYWHIGDQQLEPYKHWGVA